jgi:putative SOS response-associated peptidase YedK
MCGRMPTFRYAFHRRRCIVPVDGFFEWPYAIAMKDGSPFGIGGLWENWKGPKSGEWIRTSGRKHNNIKVLFKCSLCL